MDNMLHDVCMMDLALGVFLFFPQWRFNIEPLERKPLLGRVATELRHLHLETVGLYVNGKYLNAEITL